MYIPLLRANTSLHILRVISMAEQMSIILVRPKNEKNIGNVARLALLYGSNLDCEYGLFTCDVDENGRWFIKTATGRSYLCADTQLTTTITDEDVNGPILCSPVINDRGYHGGFHGFRFSNNCDVFSADCHSTQSRFIQEGPKIGFRIENTGIGGMNAKVLTLAIPNVGVKSHLGSNYTSVICVQFINIYHASHLDKRNLHTSSVTNRSNYQSDNPDYIQFMLWFNTNVKLETIHNDCMSVFIDVPISLKVQSLVFTFESRMPRSKLEGAIRRRYNQALNSSIDSRYNSLNKINECIAGTRTDIIGMFFELNEFYNMTNDCPASCINDIHRKVIYFANSELTRMSLYYNMSEFVDGNNTNGGNTYYLNFVKNDRCSSKESRSNFDVLCAIRPRY